MAAKVLYVLNGFWHGGAELGLLTLVRNGFLAGTDYRIVVAATLSEDLRRDFAATVGEARIVEATRSRKLTIVALLKLAVVLFRLIRRERPASVVLSLKQANIVGRAVLMAFPRVRCVAFEHIAVLEKGRLTGVYEVLLKALSGRVDEIWADCQATLEETGRYFRERPRRQRVVPLFVADPEALAKAGYGAADPLRIVMAGRLIPRKRHDLALAAVARLTGEGRRLALHIVGTGPTRPDLEALADRLGIRSAVVFEGFVPDWWRRAADHDVFLNLSDQEGFCIVAAEALMVGLPAVMNPVGGIADYARDGEEAILTSLDPEQVAGSLRRVMDDAGLRQRLGTRARARMEQLFSREAYARFTAAVTDDLVRDKAGRADGR
ncbi:glycosyltransferase [Prosthecomicrobium sp. N25]|uniref:glycosyltransferase n=1 Tax=Prosthecomicrobium sp. N25 TaxID=3129254 RepID=UPI0030783125